MRAPKAATTSGPKPLRGRNSDDSRDDWARNILIAILVYRNEGGCERGRVRKSFFEIIRKMN